MSCSRLVISAVEMNASSRPFSPNFSKPSADSFFNIVLAIYLAFCATSKECVRRVLIEALSSNANTCVRFCKRLKALDETIRPLSLSIEILISFIGCNSLWFVNLCL